MLKLDAASAEKKRERWQKIAASAAAQSGRGRIPQVLVMPSFEDAVRRKTQQEQAQSKPQNTLARVNGGQLPNISHSSQVPAQH